MKHEKEIKPQILVIDDEKWLKLILKDELIKKGYEVVTASNYDEAIVAIEGNEFDTIFADIRLEGKTGIDFLEETKKRNINSPVIIITGDPSANSAANALRFGAFDYIIKPIQYEKLMPLASKAVQHKTLTDQMNKYRSNLEAVFRSVKDAIVTVDKKLQIVSFNEASQYLIKMPGLSTIQDQINGISEETREFLFDAQIRMIRGEELDDFKVLRIDSTSVKGNTSWPTDSKILKELVERIYHRSKSLELFGLDEYNSSHIKYIIKNIGSKATSIDLNVGKRDSKKKRKKAYKEILKAVKRAYKIFQRYIKVIAKAVYCICPDYSFFKN